MKLLAIFFGGIGIIDGCVRGIEVIGELVLIGLGLKILIQHLIA